jgi:hypothetical protein
MTLELPVALLISSALLSGALVFLALKVRGLFTITVNQPPIDVRPNITVQAPTALLPESVQSTLDAINEKLTPLKPKPDDEKVSTFIVEGVTVAEVTQMRGLDKFHIAVKYVNERCDALGYERPEPGDLARRIEFVVAVRKQKET